MTGIFQQRTFVAAAFRLAADQLFPFFLDLLKADDVQQLVVELFVERVAVIDKGLFEQVRRGEYLVEVDKFAVRRFGWVCGLSVRNP